MQFVSVDIETTGLNPETCQVIEFGAVMVDLELGVKVEFHRYVRHELYIGEAYALGMHSELLKKINSSVFSTTPELLGIEFSVWLQGFLIDKRAVVAGKNFGMFDYAFLRRLPGFEGLFYHRVLDPGMLYFDPKVDQVPPDLKTCWIRQFGTEQPVAHTALEDARMVADLLVAYYAGN